MQFEIFITPKKTLHPWMRDLSVTASVFNSFAAKTLEIHPMSNQKPVQLL